MSPVKGRSVGSCSWCLPSIPAVLCIRRSCALPIFAEITTMIFPRRCRTVFVLGRVGAAAMVVPRIVAVAADYVTEVTS